MNIANKIQKPFGCNNSILMFDIFHKILIYRLYIKLWISHLLNRKKNLKNK